MDTFVSTEINHTAAARIRVNLNEIETRGFVVIRNFLDQDEINFILRDYTAAQARNGHSVNFQINNACSPTFALLRDKMTEVAKAVSNVTSTCADFEQGGEYFAIRKGVTFPWRQNHKSIYRNQNHIDYLNFYMIIIKEKREEANISVIPFDKLKARSPEYYQKVVGRGAIRYVVRNNKTTLYADEDGSTIGKLPYDINILSETPQLRAGDLLLMRGDLIHSTPPTDFRHVALAIRMANLQNRINLKRMVNGSRAKLAMMINHRRTFSRIFNAFHRLDATEATYGDLISKFSLDRSPAPSKIKFIVRVLKLRIQLMFRN